MRLLSLVRFAFPVLAAFAGEAIADDAASEGRVYSEAQAVRGEVLYQQHCSQCHGARLLGNPAAPLTGEAFRGRWEDGKQYVAVVSGMAAGCWLGPPGSMTVTVFALP